MISLPSRYEKVVKVLPGGGMSDTILCEDSNLGRQVVVKSLKAGVSAKKLQDELSALAAIRSKHVVQVLDVIPSADGKTIVGFVEEFIDGAELEALSAGYGEKTALAALYPIACGVADIHAHGRVHRDIKPDNMRVDSHGTLKIFDFGLAKLDGGAGTSQLYFSKGYSAPEVFEQDADGKHNFTKAVDVFAFGATAWWVLGGGTIPAGLKKIPPALDEINFNAFTALPGPVAAILNACMNAKPQKRPSMADIKALVAKYISRNEHRLLLTDGTNEYRVDRTKKTALLSGNNSGLSIEYDGVDFVVRSVTGVVMANNVPVAIGDTITGSVVIVLGGQNTYRLSITADLSHPEVIL